MNKYELLYIIDNDVTEEGKQAGSSAWTSGAPASMLTRSTSRTKATMC